MQRRSLILAIALLPSVAACSAGATAPSEPAFNGGYMGTGNRADTANAGTSASGTTVYSNGYMGTGN